MRILEFIEKYSEHDESGSLYCYVNSTSVLQESLEGETVLDLGANAGQELDLLADIVGTIVSVEPHPMFFSELEEKYGSHPNVVLKQAAVGTENGKIELFYKRGKTGRNGGASIVSAKNNVDKNVSDTVKQLDIASLLIEYRPVVLLKIDIEGAEYDVLERILDLGMHKGVACLIFEDHARKINSDSWHQKKSAVIKMLNETYTKIAL